MKTTIKTRTPKLSVQSEVEVTIPEVVVSEPESEVMVPFTPNMMVLSPSDVGVILPLIPPTAKGVYSPEVMASVPKVRKSPKQNTIKLLVDGERGYVTIPALQIGEGIPIIIRGHCTNWTKIRNGIKKGVLNWTLPSGRVIKIEMV
jgi:hypothetical protein